MELALVLPLTAALQLLVSLSFYVIDATATDSLVSFGEACDDTEVRCNSSKSLTCDNGTCNCVKPTEMIYEGAREKCVVRLGESCSYTPITNSSEQQRTERLDCVDNGWCNEKETCECSSNYFEDSERLCVPKGFHGASCTKDEECSGANNFYCVWGTCSCNETESVYDLVRGRCLAKAGIAHAKYGGCVRNAQTKWEYNGYSTRPTSYIYDDTCKCYQGLKSEEGLCVGDIDSACDAKVSPCRKQFDCINERCSCPFPEFQRYINYLGCVSIVRGPCNDHYCEDNHASQITDKYNNCQCLCKTGWVESVGGQCRREHGSPCARNEECDGVADLICLNGKCACKNLQVYDSKTTKCRGLVGAMCELDQAEFCIDGSSCVTFRDPSMNKGVCQCVWPDVEDSNRRCTSS